MLIIKRIALFLAVMAGSALFVAPASAQATRTWVSGVGDDANPCSRTAPCKTFQGSISKTAAGGEINCLDPGGFGAVTITKSIQIICDGVQQAGILVSGTNGVIVNAGVTDKITLSGLYFDGIGTGINGVYILQAGVVTIRNSTIANFNNFGVNLVAANAASNLVINNVNLTNNGNAGTAISGGVFVQPGAGMTATVTIANSRLQNNNSVGFRADTVGIVGSVINATIDGTVISGNPTGVVAKSPVSTGTIKLMINRATIDENSGYGISVNGIGTTARVGETVISNNGTGLLVGASAALNSFGTNMLNGNGTDGAFTGTVIPRQ